jgi:hypothetical protein
METGIGLGISFHFYDGLQKTENSEKTNAEVHDNYFF